MTPCGPGLARAGEDGVHVGLGRVRDPHLGAGAGGSRRRRPPRGGRARQRPSRRRARSARRRRRRRRRRAAAIHSSRSGERRIGWPPSPCRARAVSASVQPCARPSRRAQSSVAEPTRASSSSPSSPSAFTSGRLTRPGVPSCASGANTSCPSRRARSSSCSAIGEHRDAHQLDLRVRLEQRGDADERHRAGSGGRSAGARPRPARTATPGTRPRRSRRSRARRAGPARPRRRAGR